MKTLLPFNHPTYLRRLARELSRLPSGFYHAGERWNRASYSNGMLRIWRTIGYSHNGVREYATKSFGEVAQSPSPFDDGNGNGVCASRTP